ncbi:MAG: FAD-dependent oxidoreductase [Candidatus Marinimicrobia bacterium]|nr:FAD-dependent oxidoreductase [bacterium]MCG2716896.1 FAD-dependent oxidoreductase [Candidatus Neomarinimicrobiota bacterium]
MHRILQHPILEIPENRKKVRFFFKGKEFYGFEGEVVSSALIANGIQIFNIHKKGDTPQGLFCANGQCSHCTVIIDGFPFKSCVTPLQERMEIYPLIHLPELPGDDHPLTKHQKIIKECDVLVVGGGPSGLTAAIELAKLGFSVILIDDNSKLGGKLLLQTHKFFGSIEDCYAGTRGIDIATILENKLQQYPNISIYTDSSVVGIFKDQKAGVFVNNQNYVIIDFKGLIVSPGAREKTLIFPGNNLPGVYGAGAFQTLVNRDLIHSSDRVFVVGSGNVGLIAAFHALQAGIQAVGICDILDKVSGYKVHADKIKRMGVPIYLKHTVLSAEGDGQVKKVTIAQVDKKFQPIPDTAKTFEVDTLLIAVGLTPVDEFYDMAKEFGFKVVKAGDALEIAEASSAMFGGRIAGLQMAQMLGKDIQIDPGWGEKAEILKSKPGKIYDPVKVNLSESFQPVIRCDEEIPCDPCTSICPVNAIKLDEKLGNIMDIPRYLDGCTGCGLCILICPGLAITLAKKLDEATAEVILPHEFIPEFKIGDHIPVTGQEGEYLEDAEVLKIRYNKKYKTYLVHIKTSLKNGVKITGIQVQNDSAVLPIQNTSFEYIPENGIVCHCEIVAAKELIAYIKEHNIRDVNQLKQIRVGMGACGGKNCAVLLPRIFSMAGIDWKEVTQGTKRPLSVEVPMYALINEEDID